jgi:aminoglycoside/choline kinase family phosphotransferase
VLGAQRNTKIVGIFVRLWKRDGKPRYLDLIPRVWALLERDLSHPALAPVAAWFDANVPAELRAAGGGTFAA